MRISSRAKGRFMTVFDANKAFLGPGRYLTRAVTTRMIGGCAYGLAFEPAFAGTARIVFPKPNVTVFSRVHYTIAASSLDTPSRHEAQVSLGLQFWIV